MIDVESLEDLVFSQSEGGVAVGPAGKQQAQQVYEQLGLAMVASSGGYCGASNSSGKFNTAIDDMFLRQWF